MALSSMEPLHPDDHVEASAQQALLTPVVVRLGYRDRRHLIRLQDVVRMIGMSGIDVVIDRIPPVYKTIVRGGPYGVAEYISAAGVDHMLTSMYDADELLAGRGPAMDPYIIVQALPEPARADAVLDTTVKGHHVDIHLPHYRIIVVLSWDRDQAHPLSPSYTLITAGANAIQTIGQINTVILRSPAARRQW